LILLLIGLILAENITYWEELPVIMFEN